MTVRSEPAMRATWRDGKRYLWILGAVLPLLPFASWGLVELTGLDLFWYFGPLFLFVVVPLADLVVGLDVENPPEEMIERLEGDRYYRWVTYAFIPAQYAALIWGAWMLSGDRLDVVDKIGLALGLGVVAGIAINTAHELGHKKEQHERWLARVALAPTLYGHFFIEHNRGHHGRVATPEDPASSRLGENVWQFLPRTIIGSVVSAWHLEKSRLTRRDRSVWNRHNDVLNAWAMSVVLWAGLVIAFGWQVLPYLLLQAAMGIWLLETINYLEHYGMLRRTTTSGRYERPNPSHSWNSNNVGTNLLLYHLQRHSDHHANPLRRYQALRDFPEAPVLPTGYAGMIVLTWIPAIWRRVMDPRVAAHFDGDLTRANIHPRKRERILAAHRPGHVQAAPVVEPVVAPLVEEAGGPAPLGETTRYRCPNCDYVYDEALGDPARAGRRAPRSPGSTRAGAARTAGSVNSGTSCRRGTPPRSSTPRCGTARSPTECATARYVGATVESAEP